MSESETPDKRELRIVFDGVIAVGPPPDRDEVKTGPFFGVMARSTRRLSDRSRRLKENPPKYIPVHVPTVYTTMVPASDSRPPDEVFQLSKFHPKWYIWHPQRERMEFRFDSDGTPGDLKFNDRGSHARTGPFGQVKIHDIEMAPDARQICPERTYLLDGLLTAPAADAPVREEAAAQILVPWGRILAGGNFGINILDAHALGGLPSVGTGRFRSSGAGAGDHAGAGPNRRSCQMSVEEQ